MGTERRMSTVSKISSRVAEVHQKTKQKLNSGLKYAIAWAAYVLIGSWVFIVLEKSTTEVIAEHEKWTRFKELMKYGTLVDEMSELRRHLITLCPNKVFTSSFDHLYSSLLKNETIKRDSILRENLIKSWISEVEVVCSTSLTVVEHVLQKPSWSMVDAIYYTMTLVTTIGFGHISPTTDIGKLFCIPYALVGVPLTCILMAKTSDMLSGKMLNFYESSKKRYQKHPKLLLAMVTWMFLIVGCFVFMFIPSLIFSILEEWTMIDAFYFTFITLSTIGFGDYIAGYGEPMSYSDIYKIAIVIWIMIALGYWIFLLNFLQKAIKSNAKTLKKTFKTKNISKQAEFLKQMITKVTQQDDIDEDEDDYRERLHMMALIVESLSGTTSDSKYTKSMTGNGVQYGRAGYSRANSFSKNREEPETVPLDRLQLMTKMVETLWQKSGMFLDTSTVVSEAQSTDKIDEEIVNLQEEEDEPPPSPPKYSIISFEDLMRVKVSVKTETLPGFETLVEQSASKECIYNDNLSMDDPNNPPKVIKKLLYQ
ncbi:UNVERIFIED_CONTAM: hypothetical protein RMT77_016049 [Armadillidium vulgare]